MEEEVDEDSVVDSESESEEEEEVLDEVSSDDR